MNTVALDNTPSRAPKESTDMLTWLAGAVLVGLGLAWLIVTQPWASDEPKPLPELTALQSDTADTTSASLSEGTAEQDAPRTELVSTLSDPLRMAGLALEAGMLLEPKSLSAWSLYLKARKAAPQDPAVALGLDEVADALVSRAAVALEQDRAGDAANLINTVLAELPGHFEASKLASELPAELVSAGNNRDASQPKPKMSSPKRVPVNQQKIQTKPKLAKATNAPRNVMAEAAAGFDSALGEDRLLAPRDNSARHFFEAMLTVSASDERVETARRALFNRLLNRTAEATVAADEQAAATWLGAAEALEFDAEAVAAARDSLEQRMIQLATARPIPVSDLTLLEYSPPTYPSRAVERNIEGWVDVEFTVTTAGTPTDVTVVNTSHERYFTEPAMEAVTQWRFEPRQVRGQLVDQRTFTRLSFKLR